MVAIVDCGSGNLRSAEKALARVADERATGHEIAVTADPECVRAADRIVLPGVGAFGDCMEGLCVIPGMVDALNESVLMRKTPFLGICVGMQLLADIGREFGDHRGLGWIAGEVIRLEPSNAALKIPHMGWNDLRVARPHPLFAGVDDGANVYFVHSYFFRANDNGNVLATTEYGGPVSAAVAHGNIAGVQFHPEKSQATGLLVLENFLGWEP